MATDTKDWSVYAEQRCEECGFDAATLTRAQIAPTALTTARRWSEFLRERSDAELRRRPSPEVWSQLEYAAHVRDVIRLFTERISATMTADSPAFAGWDQEAAAIAARYNDQQPAVVAEEITADAERLGRLIAGIDEDGWGRSGTRDGREFTVDYLLRYLLHDLVHHWQDVGVRPIYWDLEPDDIADTGD